VASPTSGYRFVNWSGNVSTIGIGSVTTATTNITMNSDYSISANFWAEYTHIVATGLKQHGGA
jgi:hypothetical protein